MSQSFPKSDLRLIAIRLIACESSSNKPTVEDLPLENSPVLFRVTETLRGPLSRLAGIAGYRVLLARALSLAKSHNSSLGALRISQDARLEDVNGSFISSPNNEAGIFYIAQLLSLLVTFIGEPLTLNLIAVAWPGFSVTDSSTLETLDEPRR